MYGAVDKIKLGQDIISKLASYFVPTLIIFSVKTIPIALR